MNGNRYQRGMTFSQALKWNTGTCRRNDKGKEQVTGIMRPNTDVRHRGGVPRSSYDASVMEVERRGNINQLSDSQQLNKRRTAVPKAKPFTISKRVVWEAFKDVKRNRGSAGLDYESIEAFEENLSRNLYKIWNRMSSGTYFPPPVKAVDIPKKCGGFRTLGIPTVADRVAQAVVKRTIEQDLEKLFHKDSYGYRPGRSAIDAIATLRQRCWKQKWVVEFDIRKAFDSIDHDLLMRAVDRDILIPWCRLYISRWLKAPIVTFESNRIKRKKGFPQGGVISPLLMNLFMHYAFDLWMERNFPRACFVRYADDAVVNCSSYSEAQSIMEALKIRLSECCLTLNEDKSSIVQCLMGNNRRHLDKVSFTFLGYTFQPRAAKRTDGKLFLSFSPGASIRAKSSLIEKINRLRIPRRTSMSLKDISDLLRPTIQGWWNYFSKYHKSTLIEIGYKIDLILSKWVRRKYRRFRYRKRASGALIREISKKEPSLFPHWMYRKTRIAG